MTIWHPWRWARDHHPDVVIDCTRRLPGGVLGLVGERTVWLHRGLTQRDRRSTLTHELLHIEFPEASEAWVERETARRLITLEQLVDAFAWLRHPTIEALADHLWVDQQTAANRMQHLDPIEVAEIEAACDGDWSWAA
ncbi:MAG: hypothetical protein WBA98_08160 [Gordonia sp. (in: high G+C Gram-positive bacteria)]|uniref:hypothetical protein n=1 Tax=Gordonia sp. (in: high G+C Gram-positive bacteria) TaxID=84139 RepID=UPI003C782E8B